MAHRRCGEPACGRFVAAAFNYCDSHANNGDDDVLGELFRAQRHVLKRLMKQTDIELISKYIPRVSNSTIQTIRTRHQIGAQNVNAALDLIKSVSEELDKHPSVNPSSEKSPAPTRKDQP